MSLSSIKARLKAATPGPWKLVTPKSYRSYRNGTPRWARVISDSTEIKLFADFTFTKNDPRPDAEFISHSRQDIEALVACVETMREALYKGTTGSCECTWSLNKKALSDVDKILEGE
jgi:hypothetical protein